MPSTLARQHFGRNVGFDGLDGFQFPAVTLGATMLNSAVNGIFVLTTAVKIYRVIGYLSGSPAGTCSINIVSGIAAETGVTPTPDTDYTGQPTPGSYPPAYGTAGQSLFPLDQALTMTTNVSTVLTPTAVATSPAGAPGNGWDAIWGPGGTILTLRCATNGSGAGTLYVTVLYKEYDPFPSRPVLTGFNPAVDIP
jgi:hypothetical protein